MSNYNHSKTKRKMRRYGCETWAQYRRGRAAGTSAPGKATVKVLNDALEFSRRQMPPDVLEVYRDEIGRR